MFRKLFILLINFSIPSFLYSQGINNLWVMGYGNYAGYPNGGINIDFQNGFPDTSYLYRNMNFQETNGVICDSSGIPLFTSNGIYIANALDDTMMNGNNLNPGFFTNQFITDGLTLPQANLILQFPGNGNKYYLFHNTIDTVDFTDGALFSRELFYSVIDMSLDNGYGAVTDKNHILLSDSILLGRITAVKHANGRDWWLVFHKKNTNGIYSFLVTPDSIIGPNLQNIGDIRIGGAGQCAFSPDGHWFAFYDPLHDLDIIEFDRCSGVFSNATHVALNDSAAGGGVAFSANSQVLYVSSMNYIYQYDLTVANILASQTTVAVWDGYFSPQPPFASNFYLAQLAPDGKVYVICGNSTVDIHVINNPDSIGLACNVCQHCVHLPAYNGFTIPNHPNYFLGAKIGSSCDTLTVIKEIKNSLNEQFIIYPNPAQDYFIINYSLQQNHSATFTLLNSLGKEIENKNLFSKKKTELIITSDLPNGVYFWKIISKNNFVRTGKILIIK